MINKNYIQDTIPGSVSRYAADVNRIRKEAHQLETLPPEMMEKVNGAITEVQEEAQPSAAPENGSGDQS